MAIEHAKPGEVVDVRPLGAVLADSKTQTLFKAKNLEVVRLVMPAGKEISEHEAPGEITVQCLEGKVAFTSIVIQSLWRKPTAILPCRTCNILQTLGIPGICPTP